MSTRIGINAHLLSAQAGYRSAGIHGYIYNLLTYLPEASPNGWHYPVLVGAGQPPEHPALQTVRSSFSTTHPLRRIFWEQVIQPRALKQLNLDMYHSPAFILPRLMPRIPAIVTIHDLSFIHFPQVLNAARRLYLRTLTRMSCQKATRVIAVSESTAQDIETLLHIPRQKIDVIIQGVRDDFYPRSNTEIETFRREKNLPERFFFFLGTLEPRKNLPVLLRAYAALPDSLKKQVPLILGGGKGWDYDEIFTTIDRCHLNGRVHLPGYLPQEELPLWYNAASVFVYPSIFEGWGIPVVEAMACGCPTLVSDISSLPETAGDTGLRVPPDDENAWAQALEQAITDKNWWQKSREAGINRAAQFTWQATAGATIKTYQMALRARY